MEGGLTRNEETLLADGKTELVRSYRLSFQETVAETVMSAVEELIGRRVLAYHSQIVFDPPRTFEILCSNRSRPSDSIGEATADEPGWERRARSRCAEPAARHLERDGAAVQGDVRARSDEGARALCRAGHAHRLLEDTLTVAERRLVALGEHERVREHRLFLQLTVEDLKRAEVERILSRRTIAAICGIDPSRDVAAELFTLAPAVELSKDGFGQASPSAPPLP